MKEQERVDNLCKFAQDSERNFFECYDACGKIFAYHKENIRGIAIVTEIPGDENSPLNRKLGVFHLRYRANDISNNFKDKKLICLEYDSRNHVNNDVYLAIMQDFIKREECLLEDPDKWYEAWAKTIGNTFSDVTPYAIIGELIFLKKCVEEGKITKENIADAWRGPEKSLHDFELKKGSFEIKSTVVRTGRSLITINSPYQLEKTDGKPLYIVCLKFELNPNGEYSIKKLLNSFRDEELQRIIQEKIEIQEGDFGWDNRTYTLLEEPLFFPVDENFPRLPLASGTLPQGIVDYSYTVSLENLTPLSRDNVNF